MGRRHRSGFVAEMEGWKGKESTIHRALGFTTSIPDTVYVYSTAISAGLSNFEIVEMQGFRRVLVVSIHR